MIKATKKVTTKQVKDLQKGKNFTGIVSSDKMKDTIVVTITSKFRHPVYKKIISKKHKVYAQNNLSAKIGDKVVVRESRPISRLKRFTTLKILKKA